MNETGPGQDPAYQRFLRETAPVPGASATVGPAKGRLEALTVALDAEVVQAHHHASRLCALVERLAGPVPGVEPTPPLPDPGNAIDAVERVCCSLSRLNTRLAQELDRLNEAI